MTSPATSRRALGWGGAAALLALAVSAHATDVKLWPFFRYAYDAERDLLRWSVLGPLLEFVRTPQTRDLHVRPLLWLHQRRGPVPDDSAAILFPLAASRWQGDYQSFRFLLFTFHSRVAAAEDSGPVARRSRISLPPFLFYRFDPDEGMRLSVFPFYLDLPDFLGYEEVQAVMFPAYLRLTEPGVERRFHPFPFVSTLGGPQGSGVRVWPFYGRTDIAGREHTRYVLWPFYVRSQRLVPGYGWEDRRLYLPAYAAIDGAGRTTRLYGFGYSHTIDERRGSEAIGAPWPFYFRERPLGEEEYRTWRLVPVYGRSERGGFASRFYAWPAYRWRTQEAPDFHYERRDALLVLWRRQSQWSAASGRRRDLLTLFPVLRAEHDGERSFGQSPAFVDSLLPHNRGVLAVWAPLYGLVRWDSEPSGARAWNVLWGLVARQHERLRGPWHVTLGGAKEMADGG